MLSRLQTLAVSSDSVPTRASQPVSPSNINIRHIPYYPRACIIIFIHLPRWPVESSLLVVCRHIAPYLRFERPVDIMVGLVGNFKMNGTQDSLKDIVKVLNDAELDQNVEVVIAPPALYR